MNVTKIVWRSVTNLYCAAKCCVHISRRLYSGFLPVNDTMLHYERQGTAKETILCIPGALGCARSDFSYQLDHLSSDFTVIAFDPRGYGQSQKVKRDFPPDFYHRDAADGAILMRKLGFKKYSVLGWSDGGIAGIILSAQEHEAVQKFVLWGSNAFVCNEDRLLIEKTRDLDKWSERMKKPLEVLYGKEGLTELWNNWMDAFFRFIDKPNGDICIFELQEIQCPTLIIHGAKDALVPTIHPEFIHQNIKKSKLVIWPEGKHNLHMRFYEEFNELVTSFLLEES